MATGLTTSLLYRFKVIAHNYNSLAPGPESDVGSIWACESPKTMTRPTKLSTSTSSISITWNEPSDNGGCSISGYSVHVDDAAAGSFIEANANLDAQVRSRPSLSTHTITRVDPINNLGKVYRLKVIAYNSVGTLDSPELGVVLASLPLTPPAMTYTKATTNES
jgi:hypothetical protein